MFESLIWLLGEKKRCIYIERELIWIGLTCGGNDGFDVCMLREGFHALFFAHVEYDALLD